MDRQEASGESWRKFSVILAGKTDGAHQDIVKKFQSICHTEASSREESDYFLVFFPVTTRVGTNIDEALQKVPGGKPIILVVMHHTFKPDKVIADSSGQVNNPNVYLTVDWLYHEGKLLRSKCNDTAWRNIKTFFEGSTSRNLFQNIISSCLRNKWMVFAIACVCIGVASVVNIAAVVKKK